MGSTQMKLKRIFVAFAILAALFGCQSRKNTTVPDHLVGVWKTSAPKYADRNFEITKDRVIFAIGEGKVDIHPVENIEKIDKGKNILYTISYLIEGQQYRFSLYYDPAHGGVIRFKNQKQITWRKERP